MFEELKHRSSSIVSSKALAKAIVAADLAAVDKVDSVVAWAEVSEAEVSEAEVSEAEASVAEASVAVESSSHLKFRTENALRI